jgi:hypothetical protein
MKMTEKFPEDMNTGIPPIHGKSMFEYYTAGKVLEATGVNIDDVRPGQTLHYPTGRYRYYVTKQDGERRSRFFMDRTATYPIVEVGRTDESGEVIDRTVGLLIGVSLSGDGNFPVPFLPREGEEFQAISLEGLPSPDNPDESARLMLFKPMTD